MKKFVFVLMALLAAFMFFTCGGGDNPDGPDGPDGPGGSVIPATLTLDAGSEYTFTSTENFTLSVPGEYADYIEVTGKKIKVTGAAGSVTVTAKDLEGKELAKCVVTIKPITLTVDLNPANWITPLPANNNNNTGAETAYATHAYDATTGVLTFTFAGKNRQRTIVPLTAAQDQLLQSDFSREKNGVTFRIDATTTVVTPVPAGWDFFKADTHAGFRVHIGNPSVTQTLVAAGTAIWWNATAGTAANGWNEKPLEKHLVEFRSYGHAFDCLDPANMDEGVEPWSNFKTFLMQAMYLNEAGSQDWTGNPDYPIVKIALKSVKIEIGDTRTDAEKAAQPQ